MKVIEIIPVQMALCEGCKDICNSKFLFPHMRDEA